VIINDFHILGIPIDPPKTNSPLVVDSDAILPFPIPFQGFQTVPGNSTKFVEGKNRVQVEQSFSGSSLNSLKAKNRLVIEEVCRFSALEGCDHTMMVLRHT